MKQGWRVEVTDAHIVGAASCVAPAIRRPARK